MSKYLLTAISMFFWGYGAYTLAKSAPEEAIAIIFCFIAGHMIDMSIQRGNLLRREDESDS